MLQQILQDMYVDPDVLDALNEEQKKILFLKMRQEQVRRWKEREERLENETSLALRPKPKKVHSKNVSWLLGRDGDVHVSVIGEVDELKTSRVVHSSLGERKPSCLYSNLGQQPNSLKSSLANKTLSEPISAGRENLPPGTQNGIQLNFKVCLSTGFLFKEMEKAIDSGGPMDTSKTLGLSNGPHLRNASKGSVTAKPDPLDSQERQFIPVAVRSKLCPQYSLDQHRVKGRDFRLVPASCRVNPEGEGGPAVARGRVAALMKNFNTSSTKHVPGCPKPPVPTKPSHLQLLASPSLRVFFRTLPRGREAPLLSPQWLPLFPDALSRYSAGGRREAALFSSPHGNGHQPRVRLCSLVRVTLRMQRKTPPPTPNPTPCPTQGTREERHVMRAGEKASERASKPHAAPGREGPAASLLHDESD
ncbi:hypothetical protein GN956_G1038 [Arapaima gigas]